MLDFTQARRLISALTGSSLSPVTFQAFYDPKKEFGPKPSDVFPEWWTASLDDSAEFINYKQSQKCGIYVCVNGTDGNGRDVENITELRALFVDFDGMAEPTWSLAPHIIQKRDDTHGHAFWLIEVDPELTHEQWTIMQKQLSMFYGSDSQVIDPARVIRLPGLQHWKNPNSPQCYQITSDYSASGHRYTFDEVRDAHMLDADKDSILHGWIKAREGSQEGTGYDNDPIDIRRFTSFVANAAHPAVLGGGTHELFRVACYGHDHGIDMAHAIDILWDHYNPRCEPPWTEAEKDHFESVVSRAYKYPSSAAGCKSTKAQFTSLPPLQEPTCGWEKMRETFHDPYLFDAENKHVQPIVPTLPEDIDRGLRVSSTQAVSLGVTLTAKASHYNFARVFDGMRYDGINLIRSEGLFYEFNGRSWKMVSDAVIKAEIQRAFHQFEPADSFTSGIFRVLCDLVNTRAVDNGTWLTDTERDTKNLAVFKNGIVDLSNPNPTLIPHTHEFFCMNELTYDFSPGARCDEWMIFLDSIWGNNQEIKNQLQEFMGYCLTSDTSLQRFAIFNGKSRGGKGTITRVLTNMVGEKNMTAPPLSSFVKDSALHEMSRSSLALVPEAGDLHPSIREVVLGNFKAITGGDPVGYHVMYKGGQSSTFSCKLVVSTNGMPKFSDPSGALMNRGLVFKFTKSFLGKEDIHLDDKLAAELPGITMWAIEGLRRLRAKGRFTESSDSIELKEELKKDMFPLSGYIEDCVNMDGNGYVVIEDAYRAYRIWASSEGIKSPMNKVTFNQLMRNSALDITCDKTGYKGVTLKPMMVADNVLRFGS